MSVAATPLSLQEVSTLQNRYTYDDSVSWLYTKSNPVVSKTVNEFDDNDFIAILETCQYLEIDFLPITWQPALETLGVGGQAEIHQSLVTAALSFAFGRIKPGASTREAERAAYQALKSQLLVLGNPIIRSHPNIISLIGVCWDIQPRVDYRSSGGDGTSNLETHDKETEVLENADACKWMIWPVLVYEKTKHGDLSCFLISPASQHLDMKQKLKLCEDIAAGIRDMHKNRIVHRDIKPHNILIFEHIPGEYVAKVSDLGYSVRLENDDTFVRMPLSKPWNAPEWHHRGFRFPEIIRMDLYSYGMVCLWLLFGQGCSDRGINFDISTPSAYRDLEESKSEDRLLSLATDLAEHSAGLSIGELQVLKDVFMGCLVRDPIARAYDIGDLFHGHPMNANRRTGSAMGNQSDIEISESFSIARTINGFYEADFRVRQYITSCLEHRFSRYRCCQDSENAKIQNIVLQLLVCSRLGFGAVRNYLRIEELLLQYRLSKTAVLAEVEKIKTTSPISHHSILQDLHNKGNLVTINFGQFYSEHNILDEAKSQLTAEISCLTSELGDSTLVVQILKGQLADILLFEADWSGAETLQEQVIESYKQTLGDKNRATLSELHRLSFLYGEQDRWDEAEQLQIEILATQKEVLDKKHTDILISMEYLATIFHEQGRSEEAEQLQVEVLQIEKEVFGEDHRRTLLTMDGLTATYWGLGKFEKAQRLHLQVVETAKRVLGEDHPETMDYVENLAAALRDQGSLHEAEDLELRLLELRKRLLGHEHHSTIRSMENLAKVYRKQQRLDEAESLNVQVLQIRRRAFGEEHAETIRAMHDLGVFYAGQDRFEEAEELQLKLIEILRRVQGNENPKTLDSMMWLAVTYREQERWAEAQQLFTTLLEAYNRVLGEEDWETIICMYSIAKTYHAQQLWDQSEYWALRAIEASKRALDGDVPDVAAFHAFTVSFMEGLAFTYKQKGDTGKAIRLLEDVKSEQLAYKGPDDAKTKATVATLKEWAQELVDVA